MGTTEPSQKPREELHPDEAPTSPLQQQSLPASSPSKVIIFLLDAAVEPSTLCKGNFLIIPLLVYKEVRAGV